MILQPDEPLVSVDVWFAEAAFASKPPIWELMTTHTQINEWTWHYVIGALFPTNYTLTPAILHLDNNNDPSQQTFVAHSIQYNQYNWNVQPFNNMNPLIISGTAKEVDFVVYYISPVLSNGIILFGESIKWVPISQQRILSFDINENSIVLELIGAPNEVVNMDYAYVTSPNQIMSAMCTLSQTSGTAQLTITLTGWDCQVVDRVESTTTTVSVTPQ